MPFIHIRSLPPIPLDAVTAISHEFAQATGTDERHVTVTWEVIESARYAHAGQSASAQPQASHPVLVEVFAPDANSPEQIETMLRSAALAVATQAGVPPENVFAEFRAARSGWILDGGEIARW